MSGESRRKLERGSSASREDPFWGKRGPPGKASGQSRSRNPFTSFLDLFSPPFWFFYVRGFNVNAKRNSEPKNY